jgi:hypothetical protein
MSNLEQVSVPLPPALRAYVERAAEREMISQAAVIRRAVAREAAAARKSQAQEQAA